MELIKKRKAILMVRVEPFEIYFCPDIKEYRKKTLAIYCHHHQIEILASYRIIGKYEHFEKDVLPRLKENLMRPTEQADLLLMHDSHELSDGIIAATNLISKINLLGLETLFIKDFAIEIGRY
jgi:hypothetical protein